MKDDPTADASPRRPRYGYWLLASIPVALFVDACFCGFAGLAVCGFGSCRYEPRYVGLAILLIFGIWLVTFLAVVLPPWIPGWRRPVIAAAIGLVTAAVATVIAFQLR
jgi:hypothetical protein